MLTCVNLLARLGLAWLGSAWLASLARYNSHGIHQIFLTKNSSNFPDKKLDRKNRTLIASRNVILFPGWNHGSAIGWHSKTNSYQLTLVRYLYQPGDGTPFSTQILCLRLYVSSNIVSKIICYSDWIQHLPCLPILGLNCHHTAREYLTFCSEVNTNSSRLLGD